MRNLKKFLALVLAVMMVMGLMVTVNAKTVDEFTDGNKVDPKYKEATNVLLALGAIAGTDDGLNPEGKLTRDQLAVLLYTINKGDDGANDFVLQTMKGREYDKFDDVRGVSDGVVHFINYAAYYGWVNGTSADKYSPKGSVTLPQMLLAMLNVLGRSDTVLGGSTWVLDTIMAAQSAQILTNIDMTNPNRSVTRQEAFQIAYNALQKTYASGTHYTVYELVNGQWVAIKKTTNSADLTPYLNDASKYKVESRVVPGSNTAAGVGTSTPLTEVYKNPTITPAINPTTGAVNRDAYGRPVMTVTPNGKDPVQIAVTPDATYNGDLTGAIAKPYNDAGATMTVYYNGGTANDSGHPGWRKDVGTGANQKGLWYDDNTGIPGLEIEIYKTGDKAYTVVVSEAYIGVVNVEDDGTIKVAVKWDEGSGVNQSVTKTIADTHACYTAISAHEKGDIIAVYFNGTDIYKVADLETVEVEKITRLDLSAGTSKAVVTVVADGDVYGIANECIIRKSDGSFARGFGSNMTLGAGATLYLLPGTTHMLLVDQKAASSDPVEPTVSNYGVVVDSNVIKNEGGKDELGKPVGDTFDFKVKILKTDGSTQVYSMKTYAPNATLPNGVTGGTATEWRIVVGTTAMDITTSATTAGSVTLNSVYDYQEIGDGYVTLTPVTAASGSEAASGKYLDNTTGVSITKTSKSVALTTASGKTAIINGDTVFILSTDNGYTTKRVSELGDTEVTNGNIVVDVTKGDSNNTYVAKYVFAEGTAFDAGEDTPVEGDDFVYIDKDKYGVEVGTEANVYVYTAYAADGSTVELVADAVLAASGVYKYNDDMTVADDNKVTGTDVNGTVAALAGDTIEISSTYYSYTVGSEVIVAAGAKLEVGATVWAVKDANNNLVALWVTAAKA